MADLSNSSADWDKPKPCKGCEMLGEELRSRVPEDVWVSRNGDETPIHLMNEAHLINTMGLLRRNAREYCQSIKISRARWREVVGNKYLLMEREAAYRHRHTSQHGKYDALIGIGIIVLVIVCLL